MNHLRFKPRAIAAGLALCMPTSNAVADCLGMPAGSRQYIEIKGNWGSTGSCPNPVPGDCGDGASGTTSLNAGAGQNLVEPCRLVLDPGEFVFAESDNTANSMSLRHSTSSSSGTFHYNSMVDSFTISGPPGSDGSTVMFTVRCRMIGQLTVGPRSSDGLHIGGGSAELEIGTFSTSPTPSFNEQFRVNDFVTTLFEQLAVRNYGASRPAQEFDRTRTLSLSRTVGQPFDLAFGFNCTGLGSLEIAGPNGLGRAVMTIDFDLPEGFSITSERGWTDPDAPAACPGDIADDFGTTGADGQVSFGDFLALLGLVGPCPGGVSGCTGDIADDFGTLGGDAQVSFGDFLALLGLVGPCP